MDNLVRSRNLEAESIRSRAEITGGCVELKTVTEIRQSSAHHTFFIRECLSCTEFFLALEASGYRLKQRSDVVIFMCFSG